MRKLATALGCLVIAAYATVGQAATNHDEGSPLIAKCHFGHEGYVIFRQRPDDLDHKRANQFENKNIGGGKKKRKLMQQAAPVNAAAPLEEDLEEEFEANIEEDGALNEKKKNRYDVDLSDSQDDELEVEYSDDQYEVEHEEEELAEAEAEEKGGKKVNISCTYEEQDHRSAKAKAKAAKKDKKTVRNRSLSVDYERDRSRSLSVKGRGIKPRQSKKSRSPKLSASPLSHRSYRSPSPALRRPQKKDNKKEKKGEVYPSLEGEFYFENLDKNTKYVLSINEYNNVGNKCKHVGEFYNPNNLKNAPGIKVFETDKKGKFEKSFKNLPLAIASRDTIINRSCVLRKVKADRDHSDSEDDRKHKKKDFTKCAVITWEPPFWAGAVPGYE